MIPTYRYTNRQFRRLKPHSLPRGILAVESQLYQLPNRHLLKCYFCTHPDFLQNKMKVNGVLINHQEELNPNHFVIADGFGFIEDQFLGPTMPLIENNINLDLVLQNKKIDVPTKIKYLKQVSQRLQEVHQVTVAGEPLLLGDIHESNFIVNRDTDQVMTVDMDGCKIPESDPPAMKYGCCNEKLYDYPSKYPLDEFDDPIPNINTEWYCYSMMLLNTVANGSVHKLNLQDYYDYLQFLKDRCFSTHLIDYFLNLYTSKENEPIDSLLEELPNDWNSYRLPTFQGKKLVNKLTRKK